MNSIEFWKVSISLHFFVLPKGRKPLGFHVRQFATWIQDILFQATNPAIDPGFTRTNTTWVSKWGTPLDGCYKCGKNLEKTCVWRVFQYFLCLTCGPFMPLKLQERFWSEVGPRCGLTCLTLSVSVGKLKHEILQTYVVQIAVPSFFRGWLQQNMFMWPNIIDIVSSNRPWIECIEG